MISVVYVCAFWHLLCLCFFELINTQTEEENVVHEFVKLWKEIGVAPGIEEFDPDTLEMILKWQSSKNDQ